MRTSSYLYHCFKKHLPNVRVFLPGLVVREVLEVDREVLCLLLGELLWPGQWEEERGRMSTSSPSGYLQHETHSV